MGFRKFFSKYIAVRLALMVIFSGMAIALLAQNQILRRPGSGGGGGGNVQYDSQGRPVGPASKTKGGDSLQNRDNNEDSITIYYKMFDSSRIIRVDSSVNDFTKRYPLPAHFLYLGNIGSASRSMLFSPNLLPGFDAGFHGYDIYKFGINDTRIFQTTRPYTELDYLLGARSEQTIKVLHTQNIRPTWNALFQFRFVNAPGNFKNSNNSHSNIRLSSSFATKNRRYSGNFMFLNNRNRSSENGGIRSDSFLTSANDAYKERFNIPTWLGGDGSFGANPFSVTVSTGVDYKSKQLLFRHQYDLGQVDSTYDEDSAVIKLFYPRFRIQHQLYYANQSYSFSDGLTTSAAYNAIYEERYGLVLTSVPFELRDRWTDFTNEGALIVFPEKTNQEQFLKAGAGYQALKGHFGPTTTEAFNNLYLHGEYRNRTRNRKWDINLNGRFYLAGLNAGDYQAGISLQTNLGAKLGTLQVGFQNVNRTPSFVFDNRSSFISAGGPSFNKENWTVLEGNLYINRLNMKLLGKYYLISNYTYWDNFITAKQQSTLQNVLHLGAEKTIRLSKRWNWYAELHFQQPTGSEINLPMVYTRNRIAYEGVFYKNLNLSTGLEIRYFSPFTADSWSPFNGQWVVQNNESIKNLPDIAAFLQFRIRSLRIYVRAENLNTVNFSNGFGFTNNNLAAPLYPTPGFIFRLGFFWSFVN